MSTATPPRTDVASRLDQVLGWGAVVVPIAAWTVHIVALASLVNLACDHPNVEWVMHGLTVGLGLVCIGCALVARRFMRLPGAVSGSERDHEDGGESGSTHANLHFLGQLGFAIAVVNLVLIVVEGIYVPFLDSCPRH
jgi:hypothetical protein